MLCASAVLALLTGLGAPAAASAAPAHEPCSAQSDVSSCDADGDTVPDTVERVVAATATGADGREDADRDGVPDWTEVMACGTARCASPTKDKRAEHSEQTISAAPGLPPGQRHGTNKRAGRRRHQLHGSDHARGDRELSVAASWSNDF